jgi:peptide/nickel transport system substrate-binding protein
MVPLLLAGCVLVSCSSGGPAQSEAEPDQTPQRGGTVVIGSISDVDSWNEYISRQNLAGDLFRRIYLRLAIEDGGGRLEPKSYAPCLAESWSFDEAGTGLTFVLRPASWSDGAPITAEDVRFTWQAQTHGKVPWAGADSKSKIVDVEVLDDRRVTFRFDRRYPFMLADAVEGGILPRHIFGAVPFEEWVTHDWSTATVGSGPFVLSRHVAGQEVILERNTNYFEAELPRLDRVVVRIVPDSGSLVTQLLAGEIDILSGIAPRDARRVERDPGVELIPIDYPKFEYLGWNGARPPFDDPDVRRALTLAINREALVEDLMYGYGQVSRGPVFSFWWGANRKIEPWPYDPDEATRLLAARGYSADQPLEIELLTNSGNTLRESMLVKIQEQLGRIGVKARVLPLELQTMRQKVAGGDFDGYLGAWLFVGKVDLGELFRTGAQMNTVSYSSPEVDGLFARLPEATDWREMKPVLDEIQQQLHEDQPYTFLYEMRRLYAHRERLHGVSIDVASDPLAGLERFWVSP